MSYNLGEEDPDDPWVVTSLSAGAIACSMFLIVTWLWQKERAKNLDTWADNERRLQMQQLEKAFGFSVGRVEMLQARNDFLSRRIEELEHNEAEMEQLKRKCDQHNKKINAIKKDMRSLIQGKEVSEDIKAGLLGQIAAVEEQLNTFEREFTESEHTYTSGKEESSKHEIEIVSDFSFRSSHTP